MVRSLTKNEVKWHFQRECFLNESGLNPGDIELTRREPGRLDRIGIVYRDPITGKPMTGAKGKPFKRDRIFNPKGKQPKYSSASGAGIRLYFPPGVLDYFNNPKTTVYITEGEKKAAAATARGIPCIGIGGIWSWGGKRNGSNKTLHPDFDLIPNLKDRCVVMIQDSDARDPEKVDDFDNAFDDFREAAADINKVFRIIVPSQGNTKQGLDDFLLTHSRRQFIQLVEEQSDDFDLEAYIMNGTQLAQAKFPPRSLNP